MINKIICLQLVTFTTLKNTEMETILVQINNIKAYQLLEDLQDLSIITLIKKQDSTEVKLSDKYRGKLPSSVAKELQIHVTNSRNEWSQRDI
jgi:hypothetical protein